jgi:hypothetical protein
MPVAEEQDRQEQEHEHMGSGAKGALTSAAVAAATGAAVYGVRKALTKNGGGSGRERGDSDDDGGSPASIVGSAVSSAWDSASHALLPMAEDAADAAGKWVAQHAPEMVKERLLPRFIESFTDAA